MTKREGKTETIDIKGLLAGDGDFVRAGLETLLQAALEGEMMEAIGAEKGSGAKPGFRIAAVITTVH